MQPIRHRPARRHPPVRPPCDQLVPYRRDMPARKRPAPEDIASARRVLLDGLARDADISPLVTELAALHPRDDTVPRRGVPPRRRGRVGLVQGQPGRSAVLGRTARAVPARNRLPRPAEREAPVRSTGRSSPPRRDRTGPARSGRLVADRRLLAVCPVRGSRLDPRRRQPGGRPGAPGMPGATREPPPPSAITTRSVRHGSGHPMTRRPIITADISCVLGLVASHRAARRWTSGRHGSGQRR
jgi:hypothetical protein